MTEYFSVSEPKNPPIDDIYVVRNPILGLLNCETFCRVYGLVHSAYQNSS